MTEVTFLKKYGYSKLQMINFRENFNIFETMSGNVINLVDPVLSYKKWRRGSAIGFDSKILYYCLNI